MRILLIFLALTVACSGYSQEWIGVERDVLPRKFLEKNPAARLFSSSDSIIIFKLNTDTEEEARFSFYFIKDDEVGMEEVETRCRLCYELHLATVLAKKKYGWKKLNGNQYVSRFSWKMLLELDPEGGNRYRIIRSRWTRKSYRLLLN